MKKKRNRAEQVHQKRIAEERRLRSVSARKAVEMLSIERQCIEDQLDSIVTQLRIAEGVGFDRESQWKHLSKLRIELAEIDKLIAARRAAAGLDPAPRIVDPVISDHLDDLGLNAIN